MKSVAKNFNKHMPTVKFGTVKVTPEMAVQKWHRVNTKYCPIVSHLSTVRKIKLNTSYLGKKICHIISRRKIRLFPGLHHGFSEEFYQ